jgi:lipoprotein-releasing system permease protein
MYKLFMALRYLRAHRIIYFSIAGVAMGIMVMNIVLSVMGGFSRTMKERIRGVQSDLVVRSISHDLVFFEPDEIAAELRKLPHVTGCAPRLEYLVWMTSRPGVGRREIRESMRFPDYLLIGIDPAQENGTGDLREYFKKGKPGKLDAETFKPGEEERPVLVAGSEVMGTFDFPRVALQTARQADTPMWLMKEYQIRGWFKSGMAEYDSKILFSDIKAVQQLLRFKGAEGEDRPYANVLAVGVDDYQKNAPEVRAEIIQALHKKFGCVEPDDHEDGRCGKFVIRTWEEERSTLLAAVEVEKGIQSIILFCIVIVAGFNIIAIYTLMVRAKTRDVGILKSLGGTPGGITSIFLLSGTACGLVGSIIGIGLGLLLSINLNGIVDFVRISSRELNKLSIVGGAGVKAFAWPLALYTLALAALIVSWCRLYRRWNCTAWIPAATTGLFFALGALTFFGWVGAYRPIQDYDWPISGSVRTWIAVIGGGLPILWCLLRRLVEKHYETAFGGLFRMVGTVLYSSLGLAMIGSASVALSLLLTRPGRRFQGYDLFPRNIYYFDRVPVEINPESIGVVVALTLLVSVIFSIYPAIRAARTDPIEAIRDE